jgi:hypothetical protein
MEDKTSPVDLLFKKTETYLRSSTELYKLKAIDRAAEMISTLTARLTVIVFILLFFLIVNMAFALWIGDVLGKTYYGFFIVAGFYAITAVLFYFFRNAWIKEPLRNTIITQALK